MATLIQCIHMVDRLVAQGYDKMKAIHAVSSAYGVPVKDLTEAIHHE